MEGHAIEPQHHRTQVPLSMIAPWPRLTVVIPAYNEEMLISRCLDSLAAQRIDEPFDVIVVDNGSTDSTAAKAVARGVGVLLEPRKGVCFARQRGTLAARTPYIVNLDADSWADPDWLRRIVTVFDAAPDIVAITGPVRYLDAPRWARVQAAGFELANRVSMRVWGNAAFVMASNLAFRRAAFQEIGGYDVSLPTIGDEADFRWRLRRLGRVTYRPDLIVSTSSRRFQRGFWHFLVVELGYQTMVAYIVGKGLRRRLPHPRADVRVVKPTGWPWSMMLAAIGIVVAIAALLATRPRSQRYGRTIVRGCRHRRSVALTFDDGPCEPYTAQILDILRCESVPATFFLIGENVARHPEMARRIIAEGHIIGNHSQHHRWFDAMIDPRYREAAQAQATIAAATGLQPRFYRPPYGIHTPWQLRAVRRLGLIPVQWSGDANDPHTPGVEMIRDRIVQRAHSGAILLLHDGAGTAAGPNRAQTVAALPAIIVGLRHRGFRLVSLTQLLEAEPERIDTGAAGEHVQARTRRRRDRRHPAGRKPGP